jgi:26S proteasome regulatory subunit N8
MSNTETTTETPAATSPNDILDVTIHPLVLLSAADHYHRVARGTRKRVVGVLLGQVFRGKVDATNSFAVPFEEDSKNPVSKHCCERIMRCTKRAVSLRRC